MKSFKEYVNEGHTTLAETIHNDTFKKDEERCENFNKKLKKFIQDEGFIVDEGTGSWFHIEYETEAGNEDSRYKTTRRYMRCIIDTNYGW